MTGFVYSPALMTAMGNSTHSPSRMPLGDCRKHQHFGTGDDPARGEHDDQVRQNFECRAHCAGLLFHWFLSPLAGLSSLLASNWPRYGRRINAPYGLPDGTTWPLFFYTPRMSPRLSSPERHERIGVTMFANYSWDELAWLGEIFVMGVMILGSVFAIGELSEPARVSSKR